MEGGGQAYLTALNTRVAPSKGSGGGWIERPRWLGFRAELLTANRKFPQALRLRRELLDLDRAGGATGETLAERQWDLADLLWLTGERTEAEKLNRMALEAVADSTQRRKSRQRWRRAVLRPVLRDEVEWSDRSLYSHVWALADSLLLDRESNGAGEVEPCPPRVMLSKWNGEASPAGGDAVAGDVSEVKRVARLAPALYRLTLELQRRSAPPLQGEAWVPLWPWRVELYALLQPEEARWREVRTNYKPPPVLLPALALGSGWTLSAGPGGRNDNFGIVATADSELPPGRYRLAATSDDGVRVCLDGRPLIEAWSPRRVATDTAVVNVEPGPHTWRVEYSNGAGEFELWFQLEPDHR